jgi:predicted DNA-binding transcriptional regulator AlpA
MPCIPSATHNPGLQMQPPPVLTAALPKLASSNAIKARYGFSHSTLYRLVNRGDFEAVKINRSTYIVTESVDKYIEQLPRLRKDPAA